MTRPRKRSRSALKIWSATTRPALQRAPSPRRSPKCPRLQLRSRCWQRPRWDDVTTGTRACSGTFWTATARTGRAPRPYLAPPVQNASNDQWLPRWDNYYPACSFPPPTKRRTVPPSEVLLRASAPWTSWTASRERSTADPRSRRQRHRQVLPIAHHRPITGECSERRDIEVPADSRHHRRQLRPGLRMREDIVVAQRRDVARNLGVPRCESCSSGSRSVDR